jgi:phage gp29-like protein
MNAAIPAWRQNAKPGLSLAMAKAAAPPAMLGNAPADTAVAPAQPIQMVIRPAARDRWLPAYLHFYTPRMVENICRGAMAGNLVSQWLMFDLMEQTWPRLVKNLNELKNAVIDLDWNLQPFAAKGSKPTPEAHRRAQIIDDGLRTMRPDPKANENDLDDTLRDVMDAIGKGISVLEIDWELREKLWAPRATRWVYPRYYGYPGYGYGATANQQDRLMLFAQEVAFSNPDYEAQGAWEEFPEDKFIVSIFKQKSGHPLSGSLLRTLSFFWAAQNFTWEWFINLAQIFGAPFRWATYDETRKELLPMILDMLQNMGSSGYAALPAGTQLEIIKGVENARENPQNVLIEKADEICDIMVLGQTLTTTQGQRGSQALGQIHKTVRDEKIHAVASRAAKVLNLQLLRPCCRLNFGDENECPQLVPASKEAKDAMQNAQRDQIILSSGVPLPAQWFYERHDIPVPQPGEPVIQALPGAPLNAPAPAAGEGDTATARARAALDDMTDLVLESVTNVQARWLMGLKPAFRLLVQAAQSGHVTETQLGEALARARNHFPELFARTSQEDLVNALEKVLSVRKIGNHENSIKQV